MVCSHGRPASFSKTANGVFFTVDKSLVVISSLCRMIVVILKMVNLYPLC